MPFSGSRVRKRSTISPAVAEHAVGVLDERVPFGSQAHPRAAAHEERRLQHGFELANALRHARLRQRSSRAAAWKLPRRTMRSNARSWPRVTFMIGNSIVWPPKKSIFHNHYGRTATSCDARKPRRYDGDRRQTRTRWREEELACARMQSDATPLGPVARRTVQYPQRRAGVARTRRQRGRRAAQRHARRRGDPRVRQHDGAHALQLVGDDGRRRGVAAVPRHARVPGRRGRVQPRASSSRSRCSSTARRAPGTRCSRRSPSGS